MEAFVYNNVSNNFTLGGDFLGKNLHNDSSGGVTVAGVDFEAVKMPTIICLVILSVTLTKLVFHHAHFLSSRLPESCLLIALGSATGAILHFSGGSSILPQFFKSHEFFLYLLPPIILEASFSLHDRDFYHNLKAILTYAVIGTAGTCFIIGYSLYGLSLIGAMGDIQVSITELLIFSALISAVDPVAVLTVFEEVGVNNSLYFLVFGESLLNDGVTVVIYKVMQKIDAMDVISSTEILLGFVAFFVVAGGGLVIGLFVGVICAFITKYTNSVRVVEPIAVYCFAYLAYLIAEIFELSGIISIIAFGLVQRGYTFYNITDKSKTTIQYFTKVVATTNEIIIFLFLGLALVRQDHNWQVGFIMWTLLLTLVVRFILTYGLTFLLNAFDKNWIRPISMREQFIISYGGLRGAVAFSLAALLQQTKEGQESAVIQMFVTTTLMVVIFTVFIQGTTIKPLVQFLDINLAKRQHITFFSEISNQVIDEVMLGIEATIGSKGKYHSKKFIQRLCERHINKWLQSKRMVTEEEMLNLYNKQKLTDHLEILKVGSVPEMPLSDNSIQNGEENQTEETSAEAFELESTSARGSSTSLRTLNNVVDLRNIMLMSKGQCHFFDRSLTREDIDESNLFIKRLEEKRSRWRRLMEEPRGVNAAAKLRLPGAGLRRTISAPGVSCLVDQGQDGDQQAGPGLRRSKKGRGYNKSDDTDGQTGRGSTSDDRAHLTVWMEEDDDDPEVKFT